MNIVDRRKNSDIEFINIKKFGFFIYKGCLYLKTNENINEVSNALNLTMERWALFSLDDIVEPVDVTLTMV